MRGQQKWGEGSAAVPLHAKPLAACRLQRQANRQESLDGTRHAGSSVGTGAEQGSLQLIQAASHVSCEPQYRPRQGIPSVESQVLLCRYKCEHSPGRSSRLPACTS